MRRHAIPAALRYLPALGSIAASPLPVSGLFIRLATLGETMRVRLTARLSGAALLALLSASALAQTPPMAPDIPAKFEAPTEADDYIKRDVMIPMRDGVKLHTIIVTPKGAHEMPMLLERTPYDANFAFKEGVPHLRDAIWDADREWVADGYIFVTQDVRGKYGSKGKYVMTRPPIGALNPTK